MQAVAEECKSKNHHPEWWNVCMEPNELISDMSMVSDQAETGIQSYFYPVDHA